MGLDLSSRDGKKVAGVVKYRRCQRKKSREDPVVEVSGWAKRDADQVGGK